MPRKPRPEPEPRFIEGVMTGADFMELLAQRAEEFAKNPPPPPTPEEQAEVDRLLKELGKDPGFMAFSFGPRRVE